MKLLQALAPGVELAMNALAEELHCDASNVTGIAGSREPSSAACVTCSRRRSPSNGYASGRNEPGGRRIDRVRLGAHAVRRTRAHAGRLRRPLLARGELLHGRA